MMGHALGGIGLFLIGMILVTDGLRAAAGDALRNTLLRFTGGPFKALLSGAAVTAVVQSSSATTVATIGFVGAGLLGFEQALGLILGANIGTTATGWIVALLGLRFSVSAVALPLVGVGALTRLFAKGRLAQLGIALAGFGIIFVGLDVLQAGMQDLSERFTPASLPSDTLAGRLLLVGLGVILTAIMQSSSAAVATALAAVHAGTVSLTQAAAMVIGMNIGTTVTAGLAAMGASTAAKRTAFAHLLFNGLTGLIAFATLPAFIWLIGQVGERIAPGDATVFLATFHTAFNVVGVALVLPFSRPFARMVTRVVRHRGPPLTRRLDPGAAHQGGAATEAVRHTAIAITAVVLRALEGELSGRRRATVAADLEAAAAALRETEEYMAHLEFPTALSEAGHQRYLSTIHALDHLRRLIDVILDAPRVTVSQMPALSQLRGQVIEGLPALRAWAEDPAQTAPMESARHLSDAVASARHSLRAQLLTETAAARVSPQAAGQRLEWLRFVGAATEHVARLVEHLRGERSQAQEPLPTDAVAGELAPHA